MLTVMPAARSLLCAATLAGVSVSAMARDANTRLVVKFKPGTAVASQRRIIENYGGREVKAIANLGLHVVTSPELTQTLCHMAGDSRVQFVEEDHRHAPADVTPNDPAYVNWQTPLRTINCPTAWSVTTGSASITMAIVDTGVAPTHEDLAAKMVPGWNCVNENTDTSDVYGHGTAVAGIAGAISNNATGVASVAWGCKLMPVRVGASDGSAYSSDIAEGFTWAVDHGARVINCSYLLGNDSTINSAAQYVQSHNGLVTCSAGNYAQYTGLAANPYLITVSGTDAYDNFWSGSNYGDDIDISAPINGFTTVMDGTYSTFAGTSCAAPYVAGAAALVMSANPNLSSVQVENILKQTADDKGTAGWDMYYGAGRLNVGNAVKMAVGTAAIDSTPPTVSITSPANGQTVSGTSTLWASASDNNSVDSLSFYVDGVLLSQLLAGPYSVNWDTTKVADGSHTVTAVAKDPAGNSAQSAITLYVKNLVDTSAPTVTITSPSAGSKLGRTVKTTVSASDNVGVTRVDAYVDGALVASSTVAPFTTQWSSKNLSTGQHTLQCKAYDSAGNCGCSASISVKK